MRDMDRAPSLAKLIKLTVTQEDWIMQHADQIRAALIETYPAVRDTTADTSFWSYWNEVLEREPQPARLPRHLAELWPHCGTSMVHLLAVTIGEQPPPRFLP